MLKLNAFSFAGLLLCFTCFGLAFICIKYGKAKVHKVWSLFNISVGLWGLGAFLIGSSSNTNSALINWKLAHIGGIFIPVCFYHTVSTFCNLKRTIIIRFAYLQGFFFLLILPTNLFISKLEYVFNSFYYTRSTGFLYPLFFIIWIGLVILGHYELIKYYKNAPVSKKNQIWYFFVGMLLGFSGGTTNFLPMFRINIYPYGNFTIPIYSLVVTYAIFRYRLMDISLVVTRTGIFVAVYSLILGLPFVIAYALKAYLIAFFGDKWWLAPMGLLTVLATVGPFIYIYLERKAEERLLHEQREYQNTLRKASSGMIRVRDLKRLLNLIVHMLTRTVRIEFASIFLFDSDSNKYRVSAKRDAVSLVKDFPFENQSSLIEYLRLKKEALVYEEIQLQSQDRPYDTKLSALEKELNEIKAAVVVPSFVGNKLLGFLVLGKKLSGKLYSQDDLNVFSVLANQMALAIENALSHEELRDTRGQLMQLEKLALTGKLANTVAHELKSPLTAIKTFTEYLEQNYDNKKFRDRFKDIVNSELDRLQDIASQLLDTAKMTKPHFKDKIDAHQIIEATTFLLEKDFQAKIFVYRLN
jgi:hypothetical protein